MSNVGASPTLSPDSPEITSHTSTHQWQSFEFRMRHRRAERCLLRAEMALDAGFEDDAREALDEAERLHSENPKLAALRDLLADRVAASVVAHEATQQASRRGRALRVAAAALIFLLVGASAYLVTRSNASDVRTAPPAVANASTEPARTNSPSPATVPAGAAATGTSAGTAGRMNPAEPESAVDASNRVPDTASADRSSPPAETRPALPAFNPQFAEPRPVMLPPPSSSVDAASLRTATVPAAPEPVPVIPETPGAAPASTLDRMGEKVPASNMPAPERRAAPDKPAVADNPPLAANAAAPAVAAVNEEPRIRAILARYEAAYSGLNASAAQEVWPGVDERSLARAFDALHSQQVSLGQCSVQVEGTTASASCNGRITWTPKVGGGSQSAARQWRFQLHSGNGAWQITRAEVR